MVCLRKGRQEKTRKGRENREFIKEAEEGGLKQGPKDDKC